MFFNAGKVYFLSGDADDLSAHACHTHPVLFTLVNGHVYTVAKAVSEHSLIKYINIVTRHTFHSPELCAAIQHYILGDYL